MGLKVPCFLVRYPKMLPRTVTLFEGDLSYLFRNSLIILVTVLPLPFELQHFAVWVVLLQIFLSRGLIHSLLFLVSFPSYNSNNSNNQVIREEFCYHSCYRAPNLRLQTSLYH
jgi:hypothetical protein